MSRNHLPAGRFGEKSFNEPISMRDAKPSDLPLITVVMPAFNAERFIAVTIESVIDQSYKNLEIVVIDDGSTDGTAAIIDARNWCLSVR